MSQEHHNAGVDHYCMEKDDDLDGDYVQEQTCRTHAPHESRSLDRTEMAISLKEGLGSNKLEGVVEQATQQTTSRLELKALTAC